MLAASVHRYVSFVEPQSFILEERDHPMVDMALEIDQIDDLYDQEGPEPPFQSTPVPRVLREIATMTEQELAEDDPAESNEHVRPSSVAVKVAYGDATRRFSLPLFDDASELLSSLDGRFGGAVSDYQTLVDIVKHLFQIDEQADIHFTYFDCDDDVVTVSSSIEFAEAVRNMVASGDSALRFRLFAAGIPDDATSDGYEDEDEEVDDHVAACDTDSLSSFVDVDEAAYQELLNGWESPSRGAGMRAGLLHQSLVNELRQRLGEDSLGQARAASAGGFVLVRSADGDSAL